MKMKNRQILAVLIILLVAIIGIGVTACGSSTKSQLVGKWQPIDDEGYIEFSSDGMFEISNQYISITGTCEETGENQIALTPDSQNGEAAGEYEPIILEYSFSGDELTLSDGITPITFIRAD